MLQYFCIAISLNQTRMTKQIIQKILLSVELAPVITIDNQEFNVHLQTSLVMPRNIVKNLVEIDRVVFYLF